MRSTTAPPPSAPSAQSFTHETGHSSAFTAARACFQLTFLIATLPAHAHGEKYALYYVAPIIICGELLLLLFVAVLAPRGAARICVVALFIAVAATVVWFFRMDSTLTGWELLDLALPVLVALAVAIPLRLRSAT